MLSEDFSDRGRTVKAYHVYVRVGDTNTDIDKSADVNRTEYLWKKRFAIEETPLERVFLYLQTPEDWAQSFETVVLHHKQFPEFTIETDYDEYGTAYDYFVLGQLHQDISWHRIRIKYHQTTLTAFNEIFLDAGNLSVIAPGLNVFGKYCHYFIRGSLEYVLNDFLFCLGNTDDYYYRWARGRFFEWQRCKTCENPRIVV